MEVSPPEVVAQVNRVTRRDRLKAVAGVAAFHVLIGYALITGLSYQVASRISGNLKVFQVLPEAPPPPEQDILPAQPSPEAKGEASAPNLKARPSPVVAPPPEIRLDVPPPVKAAPLPTAAQGSDTSAGAAAVAGPGSGSGGVGAGTGSGGEGSGPGGGGGGVRARRESGALVDADYPEVAGRVRAEGTVFVRFLVGTDGRVSGCTVTRSSGNADLDAITCRLVVRRFRYRPARDAQGKPVPETISTNFTWTPRSTEY